LKIRHIGKLSFWAAAFLLLFSCANPITPTGGAKDIIPPKIETADPANKSIMRRPDKITIGFDEYISLNNPSQNITISPPINGTPEFVHKGKELIIKLPKDSLEENTTYTISFGDAIKDNNEGNVQDSFTYVFSTGPYLDSLLIQGKVIKSENGEAEEGVIVGLYTSFDDSIPYKRKPNYYVKTRKSGGFSIENLKAGTYKVVAFKDENSSYTKDQYSERIAFFAQPIVVSDSIIPIALSTFPDKAALKMLEYDAKTQGQIVFILSARADTLALQAFSDSLSIHNPETFFNTTRDTIRLYYSFNDVRQDSFKLLLNRQITDTIRLSFKTTNRDSILTNQPPIGLFTGGATKKGTVAPPPQLTVDYFSPLIIRWNRPVQVSRGTDSITAVFDTTKTPAELVIDASNSFTWNIFNPKQQWEQGKLYEIHIPEGVINDNYGLFNKELNIKFTTTKKDDYGQTTIQIDSLNADKQYIMELINNAGGVVQREIITNATHKTFVYKQLLPGNHKLKIIADENRNGLWDTGNLLQKTQPETITWFPEKIDVRAKWENEVQFYLKPNKSKPTKAK
jgi:uncharacterized protein (DUF2141 family)